MSIETIITTTGLNAKEVLQAEDRLIAVCGELDNPLSKKDNPDAGFYIFRGSDNTAKVYTVREVDVKTEIANLSDEEKTKYCDSGYRIKALHSPAHIAIKAKLGLVKIGASAEKIKIVKEETLREVIGKLVESGMDEEKARALILPKG